MVTSVLLQTSRRSSAQLADVPRARHFTTSTLGAWGLSADTVDSAALVVGELAANAARHGGAEMILTLRLDGRDLSIRVLDRDFTGTPTADAVPDDESGRGLLIVRALTDAVEMSTGPDGTAVTARLSTEQG
ncbi:ATP-binding protein [Yinghuangia sp. YIM S09857]|uniref:ATP-binding protein n=1 Tax=Yinghuangia sp. YIM S09857 TaxID=3436929 RepID=UPI003F538273